MYWNPEKCLADHFVDGLFEHHLLTQTLHSIYGCSWHICAEKVIETVSKSLYIKTSTFKVTSLESLSDLVQT